MKGALEFALHVFLKQGIWIIGAAWLFAIGSREVFVRADGTGKSIEDAPKAVKRKIILGVIVLIIGIVISL